MNEPKPELITPGDDSAWWALAQQLIIDIRAVGAKNIIIISNTIGQDGEGKDQKFRLLTDNLTDAEGKPISNLMYDVHFYKPYEFTQQGAFWLSDVPQSASYPSKDAKEWLVWTDAVNGEGKHFSGSSDWEDWSGKINRSDIESKFSANCKLEVIKGDLPRTIPDSLFISPSFFSYNNKSDLSFDNYRIFIDNSVDPLPFFNDDLETGPDFGKTIPQGWSEWKNNENMTSARWLQEGQNHYIEIPGAPQDLLLPNHNITLDSSEAIDLPLNFSSVTMKAAVKGKNDDNYANILGASWYQAYNQESMKSSLAPFINFGIENNVPVMCLEFGVIMKATQDKGHLTWLDDLGNIFHKYNLHFAYHAYRGFSNEVNDTSFGVYQCRNASARACTMKYEFVLPTLKRLYDLKLAGDINGDYQVDLVDAIVVLKILSSVQQPDNGVANSISVIDINRDGKIGIEETIHILQKVSGLRE